jgi:hypothetical protein
MILTNRSKLGLHSSSLKTSVSNIFWNFITSFSLHIFLIFSLMYIYIWGYYKNGGEIILHFHQKMKSEMRYEKNLLEKKVTSEDGIC